MDPASTWCLYNAASTSMQRHNAASMLIRRCLNVACPLVNISKPEEQMNDLPRDIIPNSELSQTVTKPTKWHVSPAKKDQTGHPPNLVRVFAVRLRKACVLSYPFSAQWRLWSDWADVQAYLSLRWAHIHFVDSVMCLNLFGLFLTCLDMDTMVFFLAIFTRETIFVILFTARYVPF